MSNFGRPSLVSIFLDRRCTSKSRPAVARASLCQILPPQKGRHPCQIYGAPQRPVSKFRPRQGPLCQILPPVTKRQISAGPWAPTIPDLGAAAGARSGSGTRLVPRPAPRGWCSAVEPARARVCGVRVRHGRSVGNVDEYGHGLARRRRYRLVTGTSLPHDLPAAAGILPRQAPRRQARAQRALQKHDPHLGFASALPPCLPIHVRLKCTPRSRPQLRMLYTRFGGRLFTGLQPTSPEGRLDVRCRYCRVLDAVDCFAVNRL